MIKTLKIKYILILLTSIPIFSQKLHHQMLSSQGKSLVIANGVLVSQSIGQLSAIGNYNNGYTIGQGFQHSNWKKYEKTNLETNISIITFPNPFISTIYFQFSKPITDNVKIAIFDINGRLVFKEEKKVFGLLLILELPQLASSNYLVRLSTPNNKFYSQILKQE